MSTKRLTTPKGTKTKTFEWHLRSSRIFLQSDPLGIQHTETFLLSQGSPASEVAGNKAYLEGSQMCLNVITFYFCFTQGKQNEETQL